MGLGCAEVLCSKMYFKGSEPWKYMKYDTVPRKTLETQLGKDLETLSFTLTFLTVLISPEYSVNH